MHCVIEYMHWIITLNKLYTDYSMNTDLCFDMQIISILFFISNIKELMLR